MSLSMHLVGTFQKNNRSHRAVVVSGHMVRARLYVHPISSWNTCICNATCRHSPNTSRIPIRLYRYHICCTRYLCTLLLYVAVPSPDYTYTQTNRAHYITTYTTTFTCKGVAGRSHVEQVNWSSAKTPPFTHCTQATN